MPHATSPAKAAVVARTAKAVVTIDCTRSTSTKIATLPLRNEVCAGHTPSVVAAPKPNRFAKSGGGSGGPPGAPAAAGGPLGAPPVWMGGPPAGKRKNP